MDPRRLLVFHAVVTAGSFSAAARALHLSQPSVSRSVAALEAELGLVLVHRRPGRLVLTDAGRELLARADAVAGQLHRAAEEMAARRRLEGGTVRLGAFPSAAATLGVDVVRTLRDRHPRLRVELREVPSDRAAVLVLRGDLDIGLAFHLEGGGGGAAVPADLVVRPLLVDDLLLCVPPGHPAARRARASLADLAGEDWVQAEAAGPGAPRLVEEACRRAGFEPRIAVRATATQTLVAAGAGITLVPALARARARTDLVLVPLAERPRREVRALALGPRPAAGVGELLDALAGAVASAAADDVEPAGPVPAEAAR